MRHTRPSRSLAASAMLCALVFGAGAANAHPHILATTRVALNYSAAGELTGIRQSWAYDPAYSALMRRQNGKAAEGALSDADLAALAQSQITSLAEFGYFSKAESENGPVTLGAPEDYRLTDENGALTLAFSQKLEKPLAAGKAFSLEIYDPHFFAYFTWPAKDAVTMAGAPTGCAPKTAGPDPIDLSQPRAIPKIFWAALDGAADAGRQFVNRLDVSCR